MRANASRGRQIVHKVGEVPRWQILAVVVGSGLTVGAAVATVLALPSVAMSALAATVALVLLTAVLIRRRTGMELRGIDEQLRSLTAQTASAQQQLRDDRQRADADAARERAEFGQAQAAVLSGLGETERVLREELARLSTGADERAAEHRQQITREFAKLQQRLVRLRWEQIRETEALLQLYRDFAPRAPMPSAAGWALDPTGLLELTDLLAARKPKTVIELGSGTSSIWLGYLLERSGGRLISVDHEARFADHTRSIVERHGLAGSVEVRTAPLTTMTVGEETFEWYDTAIFSDLVGVDAVFIDGPPARTGKIARYPAMAALESILADDAVVVLDDADRPDEQAIVERWLADVPGLRREDGIFGRQAVLTYLRAGESDQG